MRLESNATLHVVIVKPPFEQVPNDSALADGFAQLIKFFDEQRLSFILLDAKDNGRKAHQKHYQDRGKPGDLRMYIELASLKMAEDESATDYI